VPLRTAGIAAALIVAFLTVALAPCPAPVEVSEGQAQGAHASNGSAAAAGTVHGHSTDADAAEVALVPACPCGCERVPVAGGSARLGAALPSVSYPLVAPVATMPASAFTARPLDGFAPPIGHVPLPASI
jgi:hypothetical protein